MEYWHRDIKQDKPNALVDAFLEDLFWLYEKHNMSIAHEDTHGGFILNEDCETNREWMSYISVDLGGNT